MRPLHPRPLRRPLPRAVSRHRDHRDRRSRLRAEHLVFGWAQSGDLSEAVFVEPGGAVDATGRPPNSAVIPREGGESSTPQLLDNPLTSLEYWIAPANRGVTGGGKLDRPLP